MEARLYLEKAGVRMAVLKATPADIKKLLDIISQQGEAIAKLDYECFSDLDALFHRSLIEISENKLLMQFMGIIWEGLSQFIKEVCTLKDAVDHAFKFHCQLVKYLSDRNLKAVEKTLMAHLYDVALNIEDNIGHDIGLKEMFRQEMEFSS
jgi:DNA-binding GntR family transcriptional regulator